MQAKGLIKIFLVLLVITCIFPIGYTFVARMYEKDAETYALKKSGNVDLSNASRTTIDSMNYLRSKFKREFLDSVANKKTNFFGITVQKCMERQLSLGLDLKGGMSVVMEIEEDDVLRQLSNNSKDPQFNQALRDARLAMKSSSIDFLTLFQQSFEKSNKDAKLAGLFMNQTFQGRINYDMNNDAVMKVIREEVDAAVINTFNVLKTRIDQFGVVQPNVNLEKATGRIILELPGVDDPKRVEGILQQTAELGFWQTYENEEIIGTLVRVNDILRGIKSLEKSRKGGPDSTIASINASGLSALANSSAPADTAKNKMGADTTKLASKDTSAKKSDVDSTMNPLYEILSLNISQDGKTAGEGPVVGYARGTDIEKLNSYLSLPEVKSVMPRDLKLLWSGKPISAENNIYMLYAVKTSQGSETAPLSGDAIVNAVQSYDQYGKPGVSLTMDGPGGDKWARMTYEAANAPIRNRCIAIVLDNKVFSAPRVNGEIQGGRSEISGSFTIEEAQDLANILKAGKLDAKTAIIEESVVGPSLGAEAISKGIISFIVALIIVICIMLIYYSTAGIVADIALIINLFFIFCTIIAAGTALTLPGLAGVVLTIGMAVDASIIIFERVREELAKGKVLKTAITEGFQKSYSAIIDANVTNLYTALILMFFGQGPIKGFGTVLTIGIISSLITGVLLSRILFEDVFTRGHREVKFDTALSRGLFKNFHFDFVGKSNIFVGISIFFIVVGSASAVFRGFDLGVDFQGGRKYVINFDKSVNTAEILKQIDPKLDDMPIVKTYGSSNNRVQITTAHLVKEDNVSADSTVLHIIYDGVKSNYTKVPTFDQFKATNVESSVKIGATIASDIKNSAFITAILAILGIFIYIVIRFRRWQFGAGVVLSLVHDVAFTLGIFSLFKGILPFSLEVDQTIVAAILTLIGYSMNDTVVVFDRIRENLREHPGGDVKTLFNDAMNSTLSRTIMTSFYTFMTVTIIFLFGGESVRGFSFAMMIGIIVGTYSSIFIAAPVAYYFLKGQMTGGGKKK